MSYKIPFAVLLAALSTNVLATEVPRSSFDEMVKSNLDFPAVHVYKAEVAEGMGDYDSSAMSYIAAMKLGYLDVIGNIADLISTRKLSPEINLLSAKEVEKMASDNVELSFFLGQFYADETINQNARDSFFWYHNAMRLGSIDATKKVADYTVARFGGADEFYSQTDALSMYRNVVDKKGTPQLSLKIADTLYAGERVSRNLTQAYKYYTIAAEGGVSEAYFRLAYMTEKGLGVKSDKAESIPFYHKALATEHKAEAYYRLGRIHLYSDGLLNEPVKGYSYLAKAAEHGHVDAQYKLGLMHFYGTEFVQANVTMALKYFDSASLNGFEMATLKLIDIYSSGASGVKPSRVKVRELEKRNLD